MTPSTEFTFTSTDGLRIACARWDHRGKLRGVVQIAHGMCEHMGRYGEAINALTAAGFTVYANDHRGHGHSVSSSQGFGDFGLGGFELLVGDMVQLYRIARHEFPKTAFFLLGHGMGSFAAQQFALDYSGEIDGLILSGSGVLDGIIRDAEWTVTSGDFLNAEFDPPRTVLDWLSRDNDVVDAVFRDPLCFPRLKQDSFSSFLAAAPRLADPTALYSIRHDLPIYLFSGSEDPIGQQLEGVQALIERYREAGLMDITHDFYAGGRHEMLNEINRDEVRGRLLDWISAAPRSPESRIQAGSNPIKSFVN